MSDSTQISPPDIVPTPSDDEAVAIAVALSMLWSSEPDDEPMPSVDPRWRFSGRWWNQPTPMSHQRPWRG